MGQPVGGFSHSEVHGHGSHLTSGLGEKVHSAAHGGGQPDANTGEGTGSENDTHPAPSKNPTAVAYGKAHPSQIERDAEESESQDEDPAPSKNPTAVAYGEAHPSQFERDAKESESQDEKLAEDRAKDERYDAQLAGNPGATVPASPEAVKENNFEQHYLSTHGASSPSEVAAAYDASKSPSSNMAPSERLNR